MIRDGCELQKLVLAVLSLVTKKPVQPVSDKFKEMHFLADIDKLRMTRQQHGY